jgi:ribosomal protein L13
MKKLFWVLIPILCVPFLCGSKPEKAKDFHVLEITETGDVVIDAGDNITKPKMKFDIFKYKILTAVDDPNKIVGKVESFVARIVITKTTPTYSVGTIINRVDGSKPKISDISKGMLCRETTKATLKAENKIYNNQKKALKQQKQKAFSIQDLKLGMEKYEVEKICKGSLEFIATQAIPDSNGCSKAVYRMWPNEIINLFGQRISDTAIFRGNKDRQPYQLAFVIYPPCTKELITKYIKQKNITDPNELATFRSLEGYQYSQLISVSQDMEMIKLQTIQRAQQAQQQQQNQMNQNLEQIRMQNNFYQMQQQQRDFQRQSQ